LTAASTDDYVTIDRYCGTIFNCLQKATTKNYFGATGAGANDVTLGTVCTSTKPFQVCIKTDAVEVFAATGTVDGEFELTGGLAINHQNGGRGFRMAYWQISTCLLRN